MDHNDHTKNKQAHDREIIQEQGVCASKQAFGVGNVRAMHCNELFECHYVEEGVDLSEFSEDYGAKDVRLQESGWVKVKDKDRAFINSEVVVSKAISSLIKNIYGNINVEPSDLNVVHVSQSSIFQDSSSSDTFILSSSNQSEWHEVSNKKKKKSDRKFARPVTRAFKQCPQ